MAKNTTPIQVVSGINALPTDKENTMATFSVNNVPVDVRFFDGGWSFGNKHLRNRVSLKSFSEIRGLLNGFAYLMDGTYPICVPGFHSKVGFSDLFTKWDEKDVAYVNFSRLNDDGIVAALAAFGIKPQDGDADKWLILKAYHGHLLAQWKVEPITKAELTVAVNKDGDGNIEPSMFSVENNKHAWNQLYLHNGLELAIMVVADQIRVVAFPEFDKNITTGFDVLKAKITNLLGEKDIRQEALKQGAIAAKDNFQVKAAGYIYTKYPETIPENIVPRDSQITVVVNDEFVSVNRAALVKARVSYQNGDVVQQSQIFLATLGMVLGAMAQAAQRGAVLRVIKFAE